MTINGHIGWDSEDGQGINGAEFCKELLFLDTLNKSKIHLWINSPGGSVTDADVIVSAILKSKTKVDTHNVGMAASCAGPIFLAGRKRYMMPHAKFMMHPVSGGDFKTRQAFEESTVTMLSNRIPVPENEIRRMMNETTWLSAKQCAEMGMCEVDDSSKLNTPRKAFDPVNFVESYKDFKCVVNKLIDEQKPKKIMKQVTNKLKLNEAANEEAIVAGIEAIENRAALAESKLQTQETENKVKVEALNKQIAELTEAKNKLEASKKEADEKAETERVEATQKAAKEYVANLVKLGKLVNEAKAIEAAEKSATSDLEVFKSFMDAMPVNKKAPDSLAKNDVKSLTKEDAGLAVDNTNPQAYVMAQNAKRQAAALNRFKG